MADDDEEIGDENEDLTEGLEAKKTSGKKIVIIAAAVIVFALLVWVATLFIGGDDEGDHEEGSTTGQVEGAPEASSAPDEQTLPVYHSIDNLLVNLNTGGRGIVLLRISVSLELESDEDRTSIEQQMPAIMNDFQVYLRSLRPDDLEGPKGLTRIQEELLVRINQSIAPMRIRRILFEDFLITPQ